MSSRFPRPTNAVAVAALDSFVVADAATETRRGLPAPVADAYCAPDGVIPRMRLLAWGWTTPGDRLRSPSDAAWWATTYQYPLWAPLETLVGQMARTGTAPAALAWDDDLARGDAAELARSLPPVIEMDLAQVAEAPCPKYIIPPGRGQLPILNPRCLRKPLEDVVDKLPMLRRPQWLLWGAVALIMLGDD